MYLCCLGLVRMQTFRLLGLGLIQGFYGTKIFESLLYVPKLTIVNSVAFFLFTFNFSLCSVVLLVSSYLA